MADKNCPACDIEPTVQGTEASRFFTCGCVGYGYVPIQELKNVYDVGSAIRRGTIFPELDLDINEYGKVCKKWGGVADE